MHRLKRRRAGKLYRVDARGQGVSTREFCAAAPRWCQRALGHCRWERGERRLHWAERRESSAESGGERARRLGPGVLFGSPELVSVCTGVLEIVCAARLKRRHAGKLYRVDHLFCAAPRHVAVETQNQRDDIAGGLLDRVDHLSSAAHDIVGGLLDRVGHLSSAAHDIVGGLLDRVDHLFSRPENEDESLSVRERRRAKSGDERAESRERRVESRALREVLGTTRVAHRDHLFSAATRRRSTRQGSSPAPKI